eukprot:15632-Pleurochrysis_carterae.AAC.8
MAQAGRQWQRSLFPWLQSWGVTQCASDPCVFTCTKTIHSVSQSIIIGGLLVYCSFTTNLSSRWNVEDEGPVLEFLNVDITIDADCVLLKQEIYIAQLADTYLPEGVHTAFQRNHAPAGADLRLVIAAALDAKAKGIRQILLLAQ